MKFKELSRRDFMKITGVATVGLSLGLPVTPIAGAKHKELEQIAEKIGKGVFDLSFRILLKDKELTSNSFTLAAKQTGQGGIVFSGKKDKIEIEWLFQPERNGVWSKLIVKSSAELNCKKIDSLIFKYRVSHGETDDWLIPTCGVLNVFNSGMVKGSELNENTETESMLRGAFHGSQNPGVFVGTKIPQQNKHLYTVKRASDKEFKFQCSTHYTAAQSKLNKLESETSWVCASKTLNNSLDSFASHLPILASIKDAPIGWNSWDYYYRAVAPSDIIENMEAIRKDPVLSEKVKYILIDDGWDEIDEWYANHHFNCDISEVANEIKNRGFIPGIWTAPIRIGMLSRTALRNSEILIKNRYGDPQEFEGKYLIDPTHPGGQEYLRDVYTRLYKAGFRVYKIDYVGALFDAYSFYNSKAGHYEALRNLYSVIRECVKESHILSADHYPGSGVGVVDSARITIDIHNQWSHILWGMEFLQFQSWMHKRLFSIDPDFLVVRGTDTSTEENTTVVDPQANNPEHPRWRSGPVFNYEEARTRASIVAMSGGSVVLSDRISRLNEKGMELIRKVIEPTSIPAKPLDLGDSKIATLWYQKLDDEERLTVINWLDEPVSRTIDFDKWGIKAPSKITDFWEEKTLFLKNGKLKLDINPHQSKVFTW